MELSLTNRRYVVSLMLVACLCVPIVSAFTGCDVAVKPVKVVVEWIVSFATETGNFVMEKAETFANAVARAWSAFWGNSLVNNVEVNEDRPLEGVYKGVLQCSVTWHRTEGSKKLENELSLKLTNPHMVRNSTDSTEWDLAPQEKERIRDLEKQLMKVR